VPTFTTTDPRFDDIEYWIVTEPWGPRTATYIVFLNCDGAKHRSSRIYRDEADAKSHVVDDLTFMQRFWAEQLDNRERAIVCNGSHYRYNSCPPGTPARHRGFGGGSWLFKSLATGESIVSSDVWYQGVIPVWARKAFPDTHEQG
jgi:hypothetical protein